MAFAATTQTTTTLTDGMQTFYDKLFLEWEKQVIRLDQFAQQRDIPKYEGKKAQFFGYRPFAVVDTASTEGVATDNQQTIDSRIITATVKEWSAWVKASTLLSMTAIDPELRGLTELSGDQAGRTIDWQLALEIGRAGHYPIRIDEDSTNTRNIAVTDSTGNTTTVFVAGDQAEETADYFKGAHVAVTAGTNYGYAGRVTAYSGTAETWTVTPASEKAFDSSDKVQVVETVALAATDVVTTADINQVLTRLQDNMSMPFADGYYAGVASPFVLGDMRVDTNFINAQSYSNVTQLYRGEVGKWFGIRFVMTTQPYREDKMTGTGGGATNRAAGGAFVTPIIGRNSYGAVRLAGGRQRVYVKSAFNTGTDQPVPAFNTIGWKEIMVAKNLNAMFTVGLISGATGITMT